MKIVAQGLSLIMSPHTTYYVDWFKIYGHFCVPKIEKYKFFFGKNNSIP